MAVTSDSIRDLLNRPRGLNAATITELITVRTNEVNKFSRGSLYGVGENAVTTDLKEGAIKMLVCLDCLNILIDTVPSYYSESERSVYDRRFQQQIEAFQRRADEAVALIREAEGSAFVVKKTTSRIASD
tara:strand:- start:2139 stop:2528 length:390 start_codon:yes stop_codon:yes gene_type:complete